MARFSQSLANKFAESDFLKVIATVLATLGLGIGVAAATISAAHSDPGLRPLTIHRGVQVTKAFGPDDEDCIYASRWTSGTDGRQHLVKKLVCAE